MNPAAEITKIIAHKIGRSVEEITTDMELEALGIQSLDAIDIMFEIEEALDIQFPDDPEGGIPEMETVGDVINIVDGVVNS